MPQQMPATVVTNYSSICWPFLETFRRDSGPCTSLEVCRCLSGALVRDPGPLSCHYPVHQYPKLLLGLFASCSLAPPCGGPRFNTWLRRRGLRAQALSFWRVGNGVSGASAGGSSRLGARKLRTPGQLSQPSAASSRGPAKEWQWWGAYLVSAWERSVQGRDLQDWKAIRPGW
jgi:hypothetical protein